MNDTQQMAIDPTVDGPLSRARRLRIGVAAVAAAGLLGGAVAYWRSSPHAQATIPVADVPRLDGKWIRYSPEFAKRSKIEFVTCEVGSLSPVVSVTGTVNFDPHLVAAIGARIAGRVRRVNKFDGDHVKPGEVLAEIESAELGQAQAGLHSARARAEAADANEKRESTLAEQHISSQRDAELAHATASAARAEVAAAEQKLRAMGGGTSEPIGVLQLTSPIAGKVVELSVSRGQFVEPSHTAVRVADLSSVWIGLAVFERDLARVHLHDKVEISPQTDLAVSVSGSVAHVGDVIDLETRSAPVRVVVDNTDESLRPGQSVIAKIHTAKTPTPAPVIPLECLTSIDGKPTVFVAHDDTSVEPRAVEIGSKDAKQVLVASGLTPGERVVVSGVFALKAEVFR